MINVFNNHLTLCLYLSLLMMCGLIQSGKSQQIVTMPNVSERPSAPATSLSQTPVIDGDVLNDELWRTITPIDQLIQTKPKSGFPATEKTEIRIGYTSTTFYLSVVCYDAAPDK